MTTNRNPSRGRADRPHTQQSTAQQGAAGSRDADGGGASDRSLTALSLTALGQRLKALRKARGLTLETAAAATGVSRAALSKIERGAMSPSYDTLLKIADGFAMDVGPLLRGGGGEPGAVALTRSAEGARRRVGCYDHRPIAADLARGSFAALETVITATSIDDHAEWSRHDSEDLLYVLDGRVAIHLEGREPITLEPGDAMQFDGRIAHAFVALPMGDEAGGGDDGEPAAPRARVLWVSAPGA